MSEITIDPELLSDFILEAQELLDEYSSNLISLEDDPEDLEIVGAIFRVAHTLKGSSAFFNLVHIKNFAHKLENLLDDIRNEKRTATTEVIDILLSGGGYLKDMLDRVSAGDFSTELTPQEDAFLQDLLGFLEAEIEEPVSADETIRQIQTLITEYKQNGQNPEEMIVLYWDE